MKCLAASKVSLCLNTIVLLCLGLLLQLPEVADGIILVKHDAATLLLGAGIIAAIAFAKGFKLGHCGKKKHYGGHGKKHGKIIPIYGYDFHEEFYPIHQFHEYHPSLAASYEDASKQTHPHYRAGRRKDQSERRNNLAKKKKSSKTSSQSSVKTSKKLTKTEISKVLDYLATKSHSPHYLPSKSHSSHYLASKSHSSNYAPGASDSIILRKLMTLYK